MESELAPTLTNLIAQNGIRWIFVGGKGGVGKTTTSCSVALALAKSRRTLIISTDPAHNLSDAFQQKVTSSPTPIHGADNLFAMEVDPKPQKLELEGINAADGGFLQDLVSAIPGIDEAMSFAEVMKLIQTLDYETVVFDTAPTGHTLRLLQFPDTLEKGLGKLQQLQGTLGPMMAALGPLLGGGAANGGPSNELFGTLSELQTTVAEVKRQFQDPALTTFVCVCIPEFLSLYETERLVQELARQDMDVHCIVINQVIFKTAADRSALLDARVRMQQKYLEQYDELYGEDMHVVRMPLLCDEVRGVVALGHFAQRLLDPAYVLPSQASSGSGGDEGDGSSLRVAELEASVARLQAELEAWKRKCGRDEP